MEGTTRILRSWGLFVVALLTVAWAASPALATTYSFSGDQVNWTDPSRWTLTDGAPTATGLPTDGAIGVIGAGQYARFNDNLYPPGTAPGEIVVQTGGTLEHFPNLPIFTMTNHNVVLDGGTFTARYYNVNSYTDVFLKSNSTLGKNGGDWFFNGTVADYSPGEAGKLTVDASGNIYLRAANTYSGGTEIVAGRLVGNVAGSLGTGAVTVKDAGIFNIRNNSATAAGIEVNVLTGGTYEVYGSITPNHTVVLDGGTLRNWVNHNWTFSGDVLLKSDSFIGGHTASDKYQYFRGTLSDYDATHAGKLIKVGDGILDIRAANTYTGGTEIRGGLVDPYAAGSLGTGNIVVNDGGALRLRSNTGATLLPAGQTITVEGGGILDLYSTVPTGNTLNTGDGAIVRSAVWSVNINAILNDPLNLSGDLTLRGTINAGNAASMRFYAPLIEGATPSRVFADQTAADGTPASLLDYHIGLHAANSFSGGFELVSGYVEARVAGSLGSGDVLVHDGAVLDLYTGAAMSNSAVLDVRGTASGKVNLRDDLTVYELLLGGTPVAPGTYSVANLSTHFTGAGNITVAGAYRFIGGDAAWNNEAVWDLDGKPINGKKGLIEAGQTAHFNQNLYDPASGQSAPQEIRVATGGKLVYDGHPASLTSIDHTIVLDGGTFTKHPSWNLTYNGGLALESDSYLLSGTTTGSFTVTGNVTGDGKLIKEGGGTLVLNGPANSYTGGTDIRQGTVSAGYNAKAGALGTGDVHIRSGAELDIWRNDRVGSGATIYIEGGGTMTHTASSNYDVRVADGGIVRTGNNVYLDSYSTFTVDGTMLLGINGAADRSTRYYGLIQDGAGPGRVTVTSTHPDSYLNELRLYGDNTFTGGLEVTGGLVMGMSDGAFGLGDVTVHPSGRIELMTDGVLSPDAVLTMMSSPNPGNALAILHDDLTVWWLNLGGRWIDAGTYQSDQGLFADYFQGSYTITVQQTNPIPEPASLTVIGLLAGAAAVWRKRKGHCAK